ncbi:MAG: amino acid ABC transporter permease [Synergistes sp.]|nr:amino acid ABC transporter permease [Synergistes sp.]
MFTAVWERFANAFLTDNCDGLIRIVLGLENTMIIALGALVIGIIIGIFLAVARVIPKTNCVVKILSAAATAYVTFFRGTPIVVQLLLMYYGIFATSGISALVIAVAVFGMNSGAYVSEIIRSGIQSVDYGQTEAGLSLGLSYSTTMGEIVLPQAIKNILPALGNELIALIKDTSVAGFITVFDVTRATRVVITKTYDALVPYLFLALVYLVIVMIATKLVSILERRLRESDTH